MKKIIAAIIFFGVIFGNANAAEFTCQLKNNKYVNVSVEQGKTPVYRYGTLSNTTAVIAL